MLIRSKVHIDNAMFLGRYANRCIIYIIRDVIMTGGSHDLVTIE